jgi:hypothetical protein
MNTAPRSGIPGRFCFFGFGAGNTERLAARSPGTVALLLEGVAVHAIAVFLPESWRVVV